MTWFSCADMTNGEENRKIIFAVEGHMHEII